MSRPGRLDRRVELWRDTGVTQGTYSEHIEDWTTLGSRWAELQPGRGQERFAQQAERERQFITIVIRYDEVTSTLGAADRIKYGADEYDIQSVSDRFGEHRYIEVLAFLRSPEAARIP